MRSIVFAGALLVAGSASAGINRHDGTCTWDQWGGSADHEGQQECRAADAPNHVLGHIVFDPFQFQEIAEEFGDLFAHYQTPLTDNDDNFYMLQKAGTYLSCDPPQSGTPDGCGIDPRNLQNEIWQEKGYHIGHNGIEERWTFSSDWKPIPDTFFEQMFQPALSGPFIYIPGAGGTVYQVLRATGQKIHQFKPFHIVDPNMFLTGGIVVDRLGFLYWNMVHRDPVTLEHHGYIVAATPFGTARAVSYDNLIPGAPKATDLCYTTFGASNPRPAFPWPPADGTLPDQLPCGAQRPGLGVTPALGADGTVYTATKADNNPNYSYMVALRPDLRLKWATSLRGLLHDGCGGIISFPLYNTDFICVDGQPAGIDGETGLDPAQQIDDDSSAAPVALPDGSVVMGGTRDYDAARGVMLKFDRNGKFLTSFDFGWDTTPAVYEHDHTYSLITKDNHYFDTIIANPDGSFDFRAGPYYMTQLSKDLVPEWKYENTTEDSCVLGDDGTTVTCTPRDPESSGFEWCVNAPVVDKDGSVVAVNEDGNLFVIGQGGALKHKVFLNQALGAAYTPSAVDSRGRIYALNNGELTIFGD